MAHQMDMDVIRLHSLNLNQFASPEEGVERAVRAVKERNIRSLFITMENKRDVSPNKTLKNTEAFIEKIQNDMPGLFHLGKAVPFEDIHIPTWSYLFTLLAAVLFVSIAVLQILQKKWLFYLSIAGLGLVSLAYLLLQEVLLIQGLALLVAIITPVLAIIPVKGREKVNILLSYGKAIGITLLGIAIVVGLLNGNEYLVMVDVFKGVKLIYIFPIAFMFIYAIWNKTSQLY